MMAKVDSQQGKELSPLARVMSLSEGTRAKGTYLRMEMILATNSV